MSTPCRPSSRSARRGASGGGVGGWRMGGTRVGGAEGAAGNGVRPLGGGGGGGGPPPSAARAPTPARLPALPSPRLPPSVPTRPDNEARLTISSPLEAHKSHTLVFSLVALDMGFDNPAFAAIELDYSEADQACELCVWGGGGGAGVQEEGKRVARRGREGGGAGGAEPQAHTPTPPRKRVACAGPYGRGGVRGAEAADLLRAGPGSKPRHQERHFPRGQWLQPADQRARRRGRPG